MVSLYGLPAADPAQPRPIVRAAPLLPTLRYARRRRVRRLAFLDSTFPWARSGFRYHEAQAMLELAPDTLYFSTWKMEDPFPVPVHPIADFPRVALAEGITDAYGVFMLFLAGLAGIGLSDPADPHFMEGPDLSLFLRRSGIRLHGSIYPGGGLTVTPEGIEQVGRLVARLSTAFSYVPEVLRAVPGVTPVDQAFTETRFYDYGERRWAQTEKLICLFAADAPPRKGFDVAAEAFRELPAEHFHLHVVGPHLNRQDELPSDLATFHGWLSPEGLRELHRDTHVFLSPVSAEAPGPEFAGVTDGFPTQAAADAMSSGCLLVSANPAGDHRVLRPGAHYLDVPADPAAVQARLSEIARETRRWRPIADAGSARVRERMDVRHGVAQKLRHLGFG